MIRLFFYSFLSSSSFFCTSIATSNSSLIRRSLLHPPPFPVRENVERESYVAVYGAKVFFLSMLTALDTCGVLSLHTLRSFLFLSPFLLFFLGRVCEGRGRNISPWGTRRANRVVTPNQGAIHLKHKIEKVWRDEFANTGSIFLAKLYCFPTINLGAHLKCSKKCSHMEQKRHTVLRRKLFPQSPSVTSSSSFAWGKRGAKRSAMRYLPPGEGKMIAKKYLYTAIKSGIFPPNKVQRRILLPRS